MRYFLSIFFVIVSLESFTQGPDQNVKYLGIKEFSLNGVIDPAELKAENTWDPALKNIEKIHEPGVDLAKDEYLRLKRIAQENRVPTSSASSKTSAGPAPLVGTSFLGNRFDGSIPNDNTIAVSAAGDILSATNSRVYMYNEIGFSLDWESLFDFSSGVSGVNGNSKFDPKATYDPVNDRFILVYLNGASPNSSQIIVCFSQTNNPAGKWNIYALSGNVGGGVWSDFPAIGLSKKELFITTNLFTSNGSSTGSAVFQIETADGYAGNSLTTQIYQTSYFSLHPVEGGLTAYGPNFYLIRSNNVGSSSTFWVHEITNTIANNGTLNSPVSLNSNTSYSLPPLADQPGTSTFLMTGDCRIQSSYFENDRIQFTFNTAAGGRPSLYYGTIEVSPLSLNFSKASGRLVSYSNIEMAYGAVAFGGSQASDGTNASYIMFLFSGPNDFPGNALSFIDGNGDLSDYVVLKKGNNSVGGGQQYRWGDYADIQERADTSGEAWVGGSFGASSSNTETFISQVFPPPQSVASDEIQMIEPDFRAYPNPAVENIFFDFDVLESGDYTIQVADIRGRVIKNLVNEHLLKGRGRAAFNTSPLETGTYIVIVRKEGEIVFSKKFMVNK